MGARRTATDRWTSAGAALAVAGLATIAAGCGLVLGIDKLSGEGLTGGGGSGGASSSSSSSKASSGGAAGSSTAASSGGGAASSSSSASSASASSSTGAACAGFISPGPCDECLEIQCCQELAACGADANCFQCFNDPSFCTGNSAGLAFTLAQCTTGKCPGPGDNFCKFAHCRNGMTDSTESDKDCGGDYCPGCSVGSKCTGPKDCKSNSCSAGVCG